MYFDGFKCYSHLPNCNNGKYFKSPKNVEKQIFCRSSKLRFVDYFSKISTLSICKNSRNTNRHLLSTAGLAKRWSEYFHNLLNKPTIQRTEQSVYQTAEPEVLEPTYEEVTEAISKLKNRKTT